MDDSLVPATAMNPKARSRIQSKKIAARNLTVERYLDWASKIFEFQARNLDSSIDRGALWGATQQALIVAVEKYKPNKGPFKLYARRRIKGAMLDELRKMNFVERRAYAREKALTPDGCRVAVQTLTTVSPDSLCKLATSTETRSVASCALGSLEDSERVVMYLLYVSGASQQEVANVMKMGRTSVRKIEKTAREKLTAVLRNEKYSPEDKLAGE